MCALNEEQKKLVEKFASAVRSLLNSDLAESEIEKAVKIAESNANDECSHYCHGPARERAWDDEFKESLEHQLKLFCHKNKREVIYL